MKTFAFSTLALGALGACAALPALAQEQGRVISVTPVVQQVAVPRQVCSTEQQAVSSGKSGAGAVMGALAGGGLGNAAGQGNGKAVLTMIGLVGGAILGDKIEGGNTQVQNVQSCSTQTFYENRPTAYNVVYEFNGKQYSVQMPNDPGPTVQLQVTPVGSSAPPPQTFSQPYFQPPVQQQFAPQPLSQPAPAVIQQAPIYAPVSYAAPAVVSPTVVYAAPAVVYASPAVVYARPAYYYPPFSTSINFGYSRGWYGGPHRHWR